MHLREIILQALVSIRANKLRSGLTLLAISVGVFAIISANTAVKVLDTYFSDTMNLMGGDVITVTKMPTISMGPMDWEMYRNRQDITVTQMEELRQIGQGLREINPERGYRTTRVTYSDRETQPNVRIVGSNEFYLANNSYEIEEGRNFLPEDVDHSRSVAILGPDVSEILFPMEDPIGKSIRIDGRSYIVIGVTVARGAIFGNTLDRFVTIPYTTLEGVYGRNRNIAIQVRAGSIDNIANAVDQLTGSMRIIRGVAPGDPDDFEITTNESLSGAFDQFTGMLYLIGFVIGGIVLLGAGIGVMNIMLVSVTERTREIGIRKAIGARRSAIVTQFLLECIVICQIGGIIGIIFGVGLGNVAAIMLESSFVFPVESAIGGVIGMTIIGVVFGVYPAYKASRLDPIESLRYE